MVKKKKPAKKPPTKKKPKAKRPAPQKKPAKKAPAKKSPAKKTPAKKPGKKKRARKIPGGVNIIVAPALEARLMALAASMSLSLNALVLQALAEFADTWEDHQRTVTALGEDDDRMQLVVPPEE